MSDFPGVKVIEASDITKSKILSKLEHGNVLDSGWSRVDNEVYGLKFFSLYDHYYLLYKHPVHEYLDRLFLTEREKLISFMKDKISPIKYEGIDLVITTKDFVHYVLCNHDGEIYYRKS